MGSDRRDGAHIVIRAYRPDDLDGLIDLFHRAVRGNAPRHYTQRQVEAWAPDAVDREGWAARRASRPTFIAEIAGEVAGFSDLMADGHVDMLFVDPRYQGRGVARALLARVEAEARAAGIGRLTSDASLAARPVFERHGFGVALQRAVPVRGEILTNFRMVKVLAPG